MPDESDRPDSRQRLIDMIHQLERNMSRPRDTTTANRYAQARSQQSQEPYNDIEPSGSQSTLYPYIPNPQPPLTPDQKSHLMPLQLPPQLDDDSNSFVAPGGPLNELPNYYPPSASPLPSLPSPPGHQAPQEYYNYTHSGDGQTYFEDPPGSAAPQDQVQINSPTQLSTEQLRFLVDQYNKGIVPGAPQESKTS